jgi:hypothetical protein
MQLIILLMQKTANPLKPIGLTLFLLFPLIVLSQNISLRIIDQSTQNPISFVSTIVDNQLFITNEDGDVTIPFFKDQSIIIQHVSYKTKTIQFGQPKNSTTIALELKDYSLTEISVRPIDEKYYLKLLAKIIGKYRAGASSCNVNYAFYLEAKDEVYKEKIKALLNVDYVPGKGFNLPNNYLVAGDFWFMKETPFFNVNTEYFLLGYEPFAIKNATDNQHMISNRKRIKSLKRFVFNISAVNDSLIKYVFNRGEANWVQEIIVNQHTNQIEGIYFNDKDINAFTNINNTSKIAISDLELQYSYENISSIPSSITYSLEFTYGAASHNVRGFLRLDETPTNNTHSLYLGPDLPPNIYQRILLNNANTDYIDSVFANYTYAGFELSKTHGLQRKNMCITKNATNVFKNQEGLFVWNENGIANDEYYCEIVDNHLYRNDNSLETYQSKLDFIWAFSLEKFDGQWTASSYPTIMDNRSTVFYFRHSDALNSTFNVNLVFDYIELQRWKCLDSLMKTKGLSLKETQAFVQTWYNETISKANALCDKILRNEFNLDNQLKLNAEIYNYLGIDRFEALAEELIKDEETFKIFYNYMQTSFDQLSRKTNFSNSDAVKQYIRHNKKIISIVLQSSSINDKYVGGMNISLAHAYFNSGDIEMACKCLLEAKRYWPAGYNEAKKRVDFLINTAIQNCNSE